MNKIEIENLKCEGCANTIKKGLNNIKGVSEISVDVQNNIVEFNSDNNIIITVKEKLGKMGYPEKGTGNSFQKAKSYISCAIGKLGN